LSLWAFSMGFECQDLLRRLVREALDIDGY
jgi:hypothetical protein